METETVTSGIENYMKKLFTRGKKRAYRTKVLAGIAALFHDLDTKFVLREYPGIEDAIVSNFEDDDITPERAALDITTIVITKTIETQLSEETRKNIIEQLDAANVLSDEEKEPFVQRFERFAWVAEGWIKARTVNKEDVERAIHEIVGALKGVEAHERSKDRIMSALYQGLFLS